MSHQEKENPHHEIERMSLAKTERRSDCPFDKVIEDGILSHILSSLPLRDAVRTSILSRKWRHIYEEIPFLNLDCTNIFGEELLKLSEINNIKLKTLLRISRTIQHVYITKLTESFILAVNTVLDNHKYCGIESFSLRFFLPQRYLHHLDKWLLQGTGSSTKALNLHLTEHNGYSRQVSYDFPCHHFTNGRGSAIELLYLTCCTLKPSPKFQGFKHLKAIELYVVRVTDEGFQEFISRSLVLEWLTIVGCHQLVSLKVAQPLSRLKFLRVGWCNSLQEIEFHAPELNNFEFHGDRVSFKLIDATKLTLARMCLSHTWHALQYSLTGLPKDLPHLRSLYLHIQDLHGVVNLPQLPERFNTLTRLVMLVSMPKLKDLLLLSSILAAAPFLEQLELHLVDQYGRDIIFDEKRELRRLSHCYYKHLKRVEISGFFAFTCQIEIVIHLFENAIALESMIINTSMRHYQAGFRYWDCSDISPLDDQIIEQLRGAVPSHVELEIL